MGSSLKQRLDFGSTQRAADRVADISTGIRSAAAARGLDIEANRAAQNAQLLQGGNQYNTAARNALISRGLDISANRARTDADYLQQANLANQSAANNMLNQGLNISCLLYTSPSPRDA